MAYGTVDPNPEYIVPIAFDMQQLAILYGNVRLT